MKNETNKISENSADLNTPNPTKLHKRLPSWLKRKLATAGESQAVQKLLTDLKLSTVCRGAKCPNRGECYAKGTATFLIMGDTCTRNCRFCAIPTKLPGPLREDEPQAVATASKQMKLKYVVVTSVTRDDLPDGGAGHFAETIRAIKSQLPAARVEVLTPDFQGDQAAIDTVIEAKPDVFNHNLETAKALYSKVRPQAIYKRSLDFLSYIKMRATENNLPIYTKSGIMVGVGETDQQVVETMQDLCNAGCDILTIGQYLAPSNSHLPVERYVEPEVFESWEKLALEMGFKSAACGPFVRSSYNAESVFSS